METNTKNPAAVALGSISTPVKAAAARTNGTKGGRPRITQLRKIADRLGFCVYTQGQQWVLSDRETESLHWSIKTERDALMVGLGRAMERDLLTEEEAAVVRKFVR